MKRIICFIRGHNWSEWLYGGPWVFRTYRYCCRCGEVEVRREYEEVSDKEKVMQEKIFKIKWDDELGQDWMNLWNLELCLFSKEHIGGKAKDNVKVEEVDKKGRVINL